MNPQLISRVINTPQYGPQQTVTELSSLYNPFYAEDDDYMAQINMAFGSFNLHDEFFAKHQLNYLADVVRILHYTGLRINFYDVIVAVLDREVLAEQIKKSRQHIQEDTSISMQRRLNFEISVRNLMQSGAQHPRAFLNLGGVGGLYSLGTSLLC
ncbi:MAG TPA: hypothetical protein VFB14_22280 [Bryobacteraceae bacterium]|nr:hypothetical protein [Bryobacteraceae bacterium]